MPVTMLLPGKIKTEPHHTALEKNKLATMMGKEYIMDWFKQRIPARRGGIPIIKPTSPSDKILVLRAATGSGKSMTLGPELYLNFYEATKRNIAVTQPRVLTATGLPLDIVEIPSYSDLKMGDNIGYQTGKFTYKPRKGIVFMTVSVLTQQLKVMSDEEFMSKYAFIVIDECHDRSLLDTDLGFALIKNLIHRNYKSRECPFLILTSATFDVDKYATYFGASKKNIMDMEGFNYPITPHFPDTEPPNYIEYAANTALQIHNDNTDDYKDKYTDILIFVSGSSAVKGIREILDAANLNMSDGNYFVVIELNGVEYKKGTLNYRNIFKPITSIGVPLENTVVTPKRRIIISTNVAETGVTIDTLKYLIDTGYENSKEFCPLMSSSSFMPKPITRASALQRKGRVGRRFPGEWYPVYAEATFNKMQVNNYPSMVTNDISTVMMGYIVKTAYPDWDGSVAADLTPVGSFDPQALDLFDDPPVDSMEHAIEKLYVLGLIDDNYVPTVMGLVATRIPKISLENIRMLMAGYQHGANVLDLVTILAFMSLMSRGYKDQKSENSYSYESTFDGDATDRLESSLLCIADDFIETVFIWADFMDQLRQMKVHKSIQPVKQWCLDNGLVYEGLLMVTEYRDDILENMVQNIGLDPFYNGLGLARGKYDLRTIMSNDLELGISEIKKLKQCIYEGYRLNTATWSQQKRGYILEANHQFVKITSEYLTRLPNEDNDGARFPSTIIIHELDLKKGFTGGYSYESDRVSITDGFIKVDSTFSVS
jgi:HrpA-like RNA helicase